MDKSLSTSTYIKIPNKVTHDENLREMSLDKQFRELVQRCNRSKIDMEHITKSLSLKDLSSTPKINQKALTSRGPFKSILIENSSPRKFATSTNLNDEHMLSKKLQSKLSQVQRMKIEEDSDEDINDNTGLKSIKNIKELKWVLRDQKQINDLSCINIQADYQSMKSNLARYIEKVDYLAKLDLKKDQQLLNLQEKYQENCDELVQRDNSLKRSKRFQSEFPEDDINILLAEYNFNLSQQKQELDSLQNTLDREENKYQQEKDTRFSDNRELKREVNLAKAKENTWLQQNQILKESIEQYESTLESFDIISQEMKKSENKITDDIQSSNQQIGSLGMQNHALKQQISELEALIAANAKTNVELEVSRKQQKLDAEKEYSDELLNRKKQASNIKERIHILETQAALDSEEMRLRRAELTELSTEQNKLEKNFRDSESEFRDLEAEKKQIQESINKITNSNSELLSNYETEVQKLGESLKKKDTSEANLKQKEEKIERENKAIATLEGAIETTKDQKVKILKAINETKDETLDLEVQIDDIRSLHDIKIKTAEKDFNLSFQNQSKAQKENQNLKDTNASIVKDLQILKSENEEFEQTLIDLNVERETLEAEIQSRRLYIMSVVKETKENKLKQQKKQAFKTEVGRKAQLLEDISTNIQKYKIDKIKTDSFRPTHSIYTG